MSQLGNTSVGFTFSISGSFGDVAGGPYTVPSPGIFASQINTFYGNNGSSTTGRLYVWKDNSGQAGAWLLRSGTFGLGGMGWQRRTDINANSGQLSSDGYLPAGTKIWVGGYSSAGILQYQGSGSGNTDLGYTSDGDFNFHGLAGAGGDIGAYIDYTPLAAPTISNASPNVAANGSSVALTGSGFLHATSITVCGVAVTTYNIISDTSMTLTVPSGASGSGTIVVTNPAGNASIAFTAGQVYWGNGSSVLPIVAVWYGDSSGSGAVHKAVGIWVPNGSGGVKRVF